MSEAISDRSEVAARLREPAHRVSPKARWKWTVETLLGWLFVFAALGAWVWLDEERRWLSWWIVGGLAVLALPDILVEPTWRYRVHRWEIDDTAVYTRTGWFSQERRVAPISRVQTVDLSRGPLDQAFGLASVVISTASAGLRFTIDGLNASTAERLVADLTRITAATPGDAT